MENDGVIKFDLDALKMLSFYSHLLKYASEEVDKVFEKDEEVIYGVAQKYLSLVGFTDARATITPETYNNALKLGLINRENGFVTSRFTNFSRNLTYSIDLLNPQQSYQNIPNEIADIFIEAQELSPKDHYYSSSTSKIVPFSRLPPPCKKHLENLLHGFTTPSKTVLSSEPYGGVLEDNYALCREDK
jgi:hypothetical protein